MSTIDHNLPKKERILLAAEDVFSRRGYSKATLDEIIAIADTGKGTLYKYFGNKDNLFYTLVSARHEAFIRKSRPLSEGSADIKERMYNYLVMLLDFLRENMGLWRILWYELNAAHLGLHPERGADGQWYIHSLYDTPLSKEDEQRILRYHIIIFEEVNVLSEILMEGVSGGLLKYAREQIVNTKNNKCLNLDSVCLFNAFHIFAALAISVFHILGADFTSQKLAEIIVDRFMNGHAIQHC